MVELDNINLYIITHGRPRKEQRPTTDFLDASGLKYYFVMNEKQVEDYVANGVDRDRIVISTDEYEEAYFKEHKTIDVDFHGAICNREMCSIHARSQGKKYAMQFDDNIVSFSIGKVSTTKGTKDLYAEKYLPKCIQQMIDIMESTNVGFLGMNLQAVPITDKSIIRTGYAYSCFIENVTANIHWRGPFDDDVLHNLDFNTSGKYTNGIMAVYGYGKESSSNTGMRKKYSEYVIQRAMGTSNLYPDYVGVGIRPKANGLGKRIYHSFKKNMNHNIRVKDAEAFTKVLNDIKNTVTEWRKEAK